MNGTVSWLHFGDLPLAQAARKMVLRVRRHGGIPPERLWALANSGLPESGKYPLPDFSGEALTLPA